MFKFVSFRERCESGRIGLPAKELCSEGHRGFESHPLRSVKQPVFWVFFQVVPIAQLDRALDCGSRGRRFESSWARRELVKKGGCFSLLW